MSQLNQHETQIWQNKIVNACKTQDNKKLANEIDDLAKHLSLKNFNKIIFQLYENNQIKQQVKSLSSAFFITKYTHQ